MSQCPQDVYARYLLSSRGYPLWIPEPSQQLLLSRPDGLRIGDIGVVAEDGGFDVFFNICLPREHPFHRVTGVPDNFRLVELRDEDIRIIPRVENPGRIISTSAVTKIRTFRPPDVSPGARSDGLGYEFDLSSSGGALLILPEGADRYDLRNRRLFFEEATQHGVGWYRFARDRLGRMISHDSLYLITGFYKTHSWSLAAFENTAGSGEFSAQFKMAQIGGSSVSGTYTWESTRSLDWRIGPAENYGFPNQSVFIRGFKIALRAGFMGKERVEVKADAPGTSSKQRKFTAAFKCDSWISSVRKGLSRNSRSGAGTGNDEALVPTTDKALGDHLSRGDDAGGKDVVVQHVPEVSEIFHPSDIINRYLFEKAVFAHIAVTHDDDWIELLNEGQLKSEDFMQANLSRVEEVVAKNYQVVSQKGVVFLQRTKYATRSLETIGDSQVPVASGTKPKEDFPKNPGLAASDENVPVDRFRNQPHVAVQDKMADQPPVFPSIPTQDVKIGSLVRAAPPAYETANPYPHEPTDETESSDIVVPPSSQLPDIHWMLRPYDPKTSKHLVRFDVMLPVDHICYQHNNNVREPLTDQDLDEPVSTDPITRMRITFAQQPFSWTITVNNPRHIRCRDVFEAIYDCFNQQLSLGELRRVPDRSACDGAFRVRTLLRESLTEQSLGWKRVDTLLHHTLFHGLTTTAEGEWVLNIGAPLPIGNLGEASMAAPSSQVHVPVPPSVAESMQDPKFPTISGLPSYRQSFSLSLPPKISPGLGCRKYRAEADRVKNCSLQDSPIPTIPVLPPPEEPSSLSPFPKLTPSADLADTASMEASHSPVLHSPAIFVLPPRQPLTRKRPPKGPREPKQK